MAPRRSRPLAIALSAAALVALTSKVCNFSFVGLPATEVRAARVARSVGVDYLLRRGPKDADPPLVDTTKSAGATHEVTFKKRPFGIGRYAPGVDGTGAVVMEVTQQSRYPGDPQGQAFVAGVLPGWVVKEVNGQSVAGVKLEDIMENLDDEVLDPVEALSLNLKESGVPTDFTDRSKGADKSYGGVGDGGTFAFGGGQIAELPVTIVCRTGRLCVADMVSSRPWPSLVKAFLLGNLNAYVILTLFQSDWRSWKQAVSSVDASSRALRSGNLAPLGLEPETPAYNNVSTEMEALQVDVYGLPFDFLNSSVQVNGLMTQWIASLGLQVVAEASHPFAVEGLTSMWLLSSSHATIHTWPSSGFAAIDLMSCGNKDLLNASSKLQGMLEKLAPDILYRFSWKVRGQKEPPIMDDRALMLTELHTEKVPVISVTSKFQKIDVWDVFGKSWIDQEHIHASRRLYLAGHLQIDTDDEFMYHEMLVHPAMLAHENPQHVCILGGGDLLALHSALQHKSVKSAMLVEIDEMVINTAKAAFDSKHAAADPRTTILVQDAFAWLANYSVHMGGSLDLLFFDLIDITLPSPLLDFLFSGDKLEKFIRQVKKALRADGAAVFQIGEYEYGGYCNTVGGTNADCMGDRHQNSFVKWVRSTFTYVRVYKQYLPSFRGEWTFVLATENAALVGERWHRPADELDAEISARIMQSGTLQYINGTILAAQRFVPLVQSIWVEPFQPRPPAEQRPWKAETCEHIIPSRPNSPYKGYQIPYRVANSTCADGLGVFTLSRIRRGETIWKFDSDSFVELTPDNWLAVVQSQEYAKEHGVDEFLAKDWINEWDTASGVKMLMQLDDQRFTNHGYTPVKELAYMELGDTNNASEATADYSWGKVIIALRDIEPCEELVENYVSSHMSVEEDRYEPPSWWDKVLESRGFGGSAPYWPRSKSKFLPPYAWTNVRANSD